MRARLWLTVLVLFVGSLAFYVALPSSYYNPDGLRVLPGLHQVKVDSTGQLSFQPNPWRAGYLAPSYLRANVQKHLLYPLYALEAWRTARLFGYQGNGIRPLQIRNALCSAVAVGLFALLIAGLFGSVWLTLTMGLGLAFSSAFSSMATNLAEVVPAIPWLVLALFLLARREETSRRTLAWAGVILGISAGYYFVSAAIGLGVGVWLAARRRWRQGLALVLVMLATSLIVYVGVVFAAGYRTPFALWHALTFMPEQGTYGGFKLTNLVTVLLGFANSVFPSLPENFSGLQSLMTRLASGYRFYFITIVLPIVLGLGLALLISLLRLRRQFQGRYQLAIGLGLAVFLSALVSSLLWDPYHPKFWMYSNIGLWLIISGFMAHLHRARDKDSGTRIAGSAVLAAEIIFAFALFMIVSTNLARRITRAGPNPRWSAARQIARIVDSAPANLVIGGWEDEVDYLSVLVPESNLVFLPDFIFEQGRDSARFDQGLSGLLAQRRAEQGTVYMVNAFNRSQSDLEVFYRRRLKFSPALTWLDRYRAAAQPVWQDSLTGIAVYRLDQ